MANTAKAVLECQQTNSDVSITVGIKYDELGDKNNYLYQQ